MLSHDTKLRCDLVDLYFTLYESRRPVSLPILELQRIIGKPQKIHVEPSAHLPEPKKIRTMPPVRGPGVNVTDIRRTSPVRIMSELNDVIVLDNIVDMEVVVEDPKIQKIKVSYIIVT